MVCYRLEIKNSWKKFINTKSVLYPCLGSWHTKLKRKNVVSFPPQIGTFYFYKSGNPKFDESISFYKTEWGATFKTLVEKL